MGTKMKIERWGICEVSINGPTDGNPFVDIETKARFTLDDPASPMSFDVPGFYDGKGVYRYRFSPPVEGKWEYVTSSNRRELSGLTGAFHCVTPNAHNHGPVRVVNKYHFAYADGTPYRQIGTTAYAWTHQGCELEKQTLETLKNAPFNKIRLCVFPKHYFANANEPPLAAFEKLPNGEFDFERFNPAFFQHFEKRVGQLREMGIEADVILFHPYDRWGYAIMSPELDDRYLRYVMARLSAYRNVWWSLANEFDFMMREDRREMQELLGAGKTLRLKKMQDWDRFFQILQNEDPHQRLRSIHNGHAYYDHTKPWVTHASIQNGASLEEFGGAEVFRRIYHKPIMYDEVKYEGNVPHGWGQLSPQEMVQKFWMGTIAGTYVGHGETYLHPENIIWWARGGVLHGQSPSRIAFLKKILETAPPEGLEPIPGRWARKRGAGKPGEYYLFYFSYDQPKSWRFELPEDADFRAEIIDTWEMTITQVQKILRGNVDLELPGKPFIAVRITKH